MAAIDKSVLRYLLTIEPRLTGASNLIDFQKIESEYFEEVERR